jgi:MFS family permease
MNPQSERYRWYALGIMTWGQAAANALASSFGPLAPFLQTAFLINRTEVGLISTAMSLTAAPSALFGGRAADRVGERQVLILSGVGSVVAALAIAGSGTFWSLVISCLLLGLGNGIQNPAGSAAIMRWFPQRQRGVAMGIRQTGVPIGGILAASGAPALALIYGWRMAFVLGAVLALVGTVLIAAAYSDPPRNVHAAAPPPRTLWDLARDKQILWLSLIFNCQLFTQFSATTYFVLFLHEALNTPVVQASALFALLNAVAMVARIGWGLVSDRRFQGRRKPVLTVIILLTVCSALTATAMSPSTPLIIVIGFAALLGASAFAWTGILGTLVIEISGRESAGTAVSLVQVLATPASLISPPLFGFLTDYTGSYHAAWVVLTLIGIVGLLAVSRVREESSELG